uniref:Uncharacterized protein n=1 Tax=Cacopsylla melanoneura TaxID=428564 RepID=A0A8D9EFH5_9HEMI
MYWPRVTIARMKISTLMKRQELFVICDIVNDPRVARDVARELGRVVDDKGNGVVRRNLRPMCFIIPSRGPGVRGKHNSLTPISHKHVPSWDQRGAQWDLLAK